jgi:transposase
MTKAPVNLKMTKAEAVLKLLQKGHSTKDIREQLGVSLSYVHMLKKQLAEGVEEPIETVRQTAAEHNNKIKEMIDAWGAEADTDVDAILDKRAERYGSFYDLASLAQGLKNVMMTHLQKHNKTLVVDQQEALEFILSKIARITNGDADYADSWLDIAGYAKLVADRLQGTVR